MVWTGDGTESRGWGARKDGEKRIRICGASAQAGGGRGAHLVGSPFLLLDTLLVGGHRSVVGRGGGIVISVSRVVGGVLRGPVLGCGVVGDGGEDGRWEYALK